MSFRVESSESNMKVARFVRHLLSVLVALAVTPLPMQAQEAGPLVSQSPCAPYSAPTYEQYVENTRTSYATEMEAAKSEGVPMRSALAIVSREVFDQDVAVARSIECTNIVYLSDGLKVKGLMWRPKDQGAKPLPLIVYNRGGNREFGRVSTWNSVHRLAAEGFVVLASQYRGVDGGEGQEEFGGADVHDILNLVPVARSLGFVDMDNVFMLGWSRGGMMTFLAAKQGMPANALAVFGPLLDLVEEGKRRPALVENVWSALMPGFATRRDALLRERSPMYWPEEIEVPTLLMHGGADWRASPADTLAFAQKLQQAGKTYELVVYANDDHALNGNKNDSYRHIASWFRKHMR
jgi:dipeptidyl aminopeptidase/acylaminoacyl peptidase